MLKLKKYNFFRVVNKFNFKFLLNLNLIYFYTKIGYMKIFMPSFYFIKNNKNSINFVFINKIKYLNILKQFLYYFNKCLKFFFFKIRLRGLGYKVEKFSIKLYRFFFAYNHYFYFHVPKDIFVKNRKRTLIIFSNNLMKINDIFSHLLLLKKLDLYERTNTFVVSRQIKFFKKRK
jgi:hypothetical protein